MSITRQLQAASQQRDTAKEALAAEQQKGAALQTQLQS
jgi:hypothetical protein